MLARADPDCAASKGCSFVLRLEDCCDAACDVAEEEEEAIWLCSSDLVERIGCGG